MAGLHKLKDIAQIQQGMREKVFEKIITGEITQTLIEKSEYYELMQGRLLPLKELEKILDDNETIFRYNEKRLFARKQCHTESLQKASAIYHR